MRRFSIFNTWSDLLFQKITELEGQNDTLKMELHQLHEKSLNVQDLVNQNTLLKEQIEIMNEATVSMFQI